jgi:hypothetical protein
MNGPKRLTLFAGMLMATVCGFAVIASVRTRADDPPKELASYVRPIKQDEATREIFEAAGTYSVGFSYKIPADKEIIFTFMALDEGGIVESLSKIYTLPQRDDRPDYNRVRLVMIDPAKFTEGYSGNGRWVLKIGPTVQSAWEPRLYAGANSRSSWTEGKAVENPEVGKDYSLWSIKAYPKGLNAITPETPTVFSYEIFVRLEPREKGDFIVYEGDSKDVVKWNEQRKKK